MRKFFTLALLVGALALITGVVAAAPPGSDPPGLERAIAAREANSARLLAIEGVVGTAVGLGEDGSAVVQVFLREASVRGVPSHADGVRIETVITGVFFARDDPMARQERPVPIGVSVGHPDITAGTIGARVKDGAGNVYALSNNHVLANSNNASVGDAALQPGPYDGGLNPVDSIGTLYDFEIIRFCSGPFVSSCPENVMDAAIAVSTTQMLGTGTLSSSYGTPSTLATSAALGMSVQKNGRATGHTLGEVSGINAEVFVCYDPRCRHQDLARFTNQITITDGTFSAGGDSGSLIVTTEGNQPVALLFAGSSTHTIANPIGPVLTRFGVAIDDGSDDVDLGDAPTVTITRPAHGSTFHVGESITFSGIAEDTEDGDLTANLSWSSSLDSHLGMGGSVTISLSEGAHTVIASVIDSDGNTGSASVSVTVVNDAPVVTISSPGEGDIYGSGATILFEGFADDTEDGDLTGALLWTSSIDGQVGSAGSFSAALSDGVHTITASVTDSGGKSASASVSITVGDPPPAATTLHVGVLSGASINNGNTWTAVVTITVLSDGEPVGSATVSGNWSTSAEGTCTTGSNGQCSVSLAGIPKRTSSVTWTVGHITHATLAYEPGDNAQTSIVVSKP